MFFLVKSLTVVLDSVNLTIFYFFAGVTVLLAFSVFMLAIAEKMPETSESIPLIGKFFHIPSFCPKNSSKSCPKNAPQNKDFSIEGAVVPGLLLCS